MPGVTCVCPGFAAGSLREPQVSHLGWGVGEPAGSFGSACKMLGSVGWVFFHHLGILFLVTVRSETSVPVRPPTNSQVARVSFGVARGLSALRVASEAGAPSAQVSAFPPERCGDLRPGAGGGLSWQRRAPAGCFFCIKIQMLSVSL